MKQPEEIVICPSCGIEFDARHIAGMKTCPVCGKPFVQTSEPQPSGVDASLANAFRNPANGHIERIDGAWAWVLLFGCIYFAAKGVWTHAVAGLLLAIITGGISWFIYPIFAARIMRTHYLRKGWQPA